MIKVDKLAENIRSNTLFSNKQRNAAFEAIIQEYFDQRRHDKLDWSEIVLKEVTETREKIQKVRIFRFLGVFLKWP